MGHQLLDDRRDQFARVRLISPERTRNIGKIGGKFGSSQIQPDANDKRGTVGQGQDRFGKNAAHLFALVIQIVYPLDIGLPMADTIDCPSDGNRRGTRQ